MSATKRIWSNIKWILATLKPYKDYHVFYEHFRTFERCGLERNKETIRRMYLLYLMIGMNVCLLLFHWLADHKSYRLVLLTFDYLAYADLPKDVRLEMIAVMAGSAMMLRAVFCNSIHHVRFIFGMIVFHERKFIFNVKRPLRKWFMNVFNSQQLIYVPFNIWAVYTYVTFLISAMQLMHNGESIWYKCAQVILFTACFMVLVSNIHLIVYVYSLATSICIFSYIVMTVRINLLTKTLTNKKSGKQTLRTVLRYLHENQHTMAYLFSLNN